VIRKSRAKSIACGVNAYDGKGLRLLGVDRQIALQGDQAGGGGADLGEVLGEQGLLAGRGDDQAGVDGVGVHRAHGQRDHA
jgi:hypothetical protein